MLYRDVREFTQALKGRDFLGGGEPNLADLAVFGVLRAIQVGAWSWVPGLRIVGGYLVLGARAAFCGCCGLVVALGGPGDQHPQRNFVGAEGHACAFPALTPSPPPGASLLHLSCSHPLPGASLLHVQGTDTYRDVLANTDIGPWVVRMINAVGPSARIADGSTQNAPAAA